MLGRLRYGPSAVTPYDALRWAPEGSARCLGRDDIGAIAAGMSQETPAYRALTEAAAFGPDFAAGATVHRQECASAIHGRELLAVVEGQVHDGGPARLEESASLRQQLNRARNKGVTIKELTPAALAGCVNELKAVVVDWLHGVEGVVGVAKGPAFVVGEDDGDVIELGDRDVWARLVLWGSQEKEGEG